MSQHPYRPLTSRQFRLLSLLPGDESTQIRMTLRNVSIDDKPTFEALSYEWGPVSSNTSQIRVDNEPFTIRQNLWLFLKRIRASSKIPQVIYADAICINQKDNEEKGRQVGLMSDIYICAKKVLVWLGEHDLNSEIVLGTKVSASSRRARQTSRPIAQIADQSLPTSTELASAWTSFLSRSYWNRTWIVQEFLLANSIVIFCGSDKMSVDELFMKPLRDHFGDMMQKNKQNKEGQLDGIPRSFLLYFWKYNQKKSLGGFGKRKPYFPKVDIFELAFNFQHTDCQMVLDHVYALLALEDPSNGPPIRPHYDILAQTLFVQICMLKLPRVVESVDKVTDDGVLRVAQLFRGLKLTFDNAEEILDILLESEQSKTYDSLVVATICKAFDVFGFFKPERKLWIVPQTTLNGLQTPDRIIPPMRKWQKTEKESGNWYDGHSAQVHEPPGLGFAQLDEPLWSHYSVLRDTGTRGKANANAAHSRHMNNMQTMGSINNMNIMTMNNLATMGSGGGRFGGGGGGGGGI